MDDGEPSSERANLSRIVENLSQIEIQRTDAHKTPKIPKFFREEPVSFFIIVEASY